MPNAEPDYEYEVFFSYKRHPQSLEWTRQVTAKLRFFLSQELNLNEVRMFVDEEEIAPGEQWPLRLQSALRLRRVSTTLRQSAKEFSEYFFLENPMRRVC